MAKVISIDLGKINGIILAELSEKIYQADIVKTELINDYIINLNNIEDISKIIIGNGTTSGDIKKKLDF